MSKVYIRSITPQTLIDEITNRCLSDDPLEEISQTIHITKGHISQKVMKGISKRMNRRSLEELFKMAERYNCPSVINCRGFINNER